MHVRLDHWVPDPAIRTHHRREAAAPPDVLWDAALGVRLAETRTLGRVVRWRIPGTTADQTFSELFRRYPFTVLEEGERHIVSGLCGRIWTFARDYPDLDGPEAFAAWDEPGTVRVAFAHWVTEDSELVSEARVQAVDRRAGMRLKALWTVVGRFERLIGAEPLPIAVRRAEESAALEPRQ